MRGKKNSVGERYIEYECDMPSRKKTYLKKAELVEYLACFKWGSAPGLTPRLLQFLTAQLTCK